MASSTYVPLPIELHSLHKTKGPHASVFSVLMELYQHSEVLVLHRLYDDRFLPWLHVRVLTPAEECGEVVLAVYQPCYPPFTGKDADVPMGPPCESRIVKCARDKLIIKGRMIHEDRAHPDKFKITFRPDPTPDTVWTVSLEMFGYFTITVYILRKGYFVPEFRYVPFKYADPNIGPGTPILYTPESLKFDSIFGNIVGWHSRATEQLILSYSDGIVHSSVHFCHAVYSADPDPPKTKTNVNKASSSAVDPSPSASSLSLDSDWDKLSIQ